MKFLLIVVMIILASLHAQADETPCKTSNDELKQDGACWRSLNSSQKVDIVHGMVVGIQTRRLANELVGHVTSYAFFRDYLAAPKYTTVGDVVDYFDQLYETPANRSIKWPYAMMLAAMKARDDDSDDRLALIKLLREFHDIPMLASLVGVKSPNVVSMKAGGRIFDLHLSLISDDGLSPTQRESVMRFIRAFSESGDYSCDTPAMFSIRYTYEFFRKNMLTGELMFSTGLVLCGGSKPIVIADFIPGGGPHSLNWLLLRTGLAKLDSDLDPKRPENSIDREIPLILAQTAQAKQLYIYGGWKDPFVEAVLNQKAE